MIRENLNKSLIIKLTKLYMLKKSLYIVFFIEIILFTIIGLDCFIEDKLIPWSFFFYSMIVAILFLNVNNMILNERIKANLFRIIFFIFILVLIISLLIKQELIWSIGGVIFGLIIANKLAPIFLQNKK